jgi:UDP-3-O-[3-hydroxymyristoyl] glucosamine N-acyltransferase
VNVAAQSGVAHDVPAGQRVAGLPAVDEKRWARNAVAMVRLHELRREVRELVRKVATLEAKEEP